MASEGNKLLITAEVKLVAQGVWALLSSRVVILLLGFILAIALPRIMGSADYGYWILFRSIITILVGVSVVGSSSLMNIHYVTHRSKGQNVEAALLFKTVLLFRLLVGILLSILGYFLLVNLKHDVFGPVEGLWVTLSILLKVLGSSCLLLLVGERQYRRFAVALLAQQCLVPFVVLLMYYKGGFAWVAPGCALGEALGLIFYVILVSQFLSWPKGMIPRSELKSLSGFAGTMMASQYINNMYIQGIPYLMGVLSVPVHIVGYVGLALRLRMLLWSAIRQMSGTVNASLRKLLDLGERERAGQWQQFICRIGVIVFMFGSGLFGVLGPSILRSVWGEEYVPGFNIMFITLMGAVFFWKADYDSNFLTLMKKPKWQLYGRIGLLGSAVAVIIALEPQLGGLGAAMGMLVGSVVFYILTQVYMKKILHRPMGDYVYFFPLVVTVLAASIHPLLPNMYIRCVVWVFTFILTLFISRTLQWQELIQASRTMIEALKTDGSHS